MNNPLQTYVNTAPTITPDAVLVGMRHKFIDMMIGADWAWCDDEFTHAQTGETVPYDEAFKFWCAAKMQATPPPF